MLKTPNKNRLAIKIFCYGIFVVWIISAVLYCTTANGETTFAHWITRTFYMNVLFYTQQTGIFAVIYAIITLIDKKKNNIIGILCISDFIITNVFAWIIFNSINGWFTNPYHLVIDLINHMIWFLLVFLIFILTCLNPKKNVNYTKTSYRQIAVYAWIHPTIFFIGVLITNFVKMPYNWDPSTYINGYFTPYGALTDYNPNGGGNLALLATIPAFYGLIYLTNLFFNKIDNLSFHNDKITNINQKHFKYVNLSIYVNTILFCFTFFISVVYELIAVFIPNLVTNRNYNILEIISIIFSTIVLTINICLYRYLKRQSIYYRIRILLLLSFIFSVIKIMGMILSVILPYDAVFEEMINRMCLTSVLYSLFILFFLGVSYTYLYRSQITR